MFSRTNFSQTILTGTNVRTAGILAAALATTVALSGCTINVGTPDNGMMGNGSTTSMMGSSNSSEFSNTDVMFAQMMIPHHQQAVDMSDLALAISANPEVLALAQKIRDAQAPEITLMTSWIEKAGATTTMGHGTDDMGMGMGGMMSDDEMTALNNATGTAFDTLYLEGMIAHHEGALQMVKMISNSGNAEVKKLGDAIVTGQTAEIAQMKTMLAK
ncbi:DUF305 domain-containing protein [Alpinimonas psychrophila]|uniref:Uncharacterized protein (DUF305 family) n=1 Tax=Alpinimonas psychrophila TaxID=748908 RepID=A0A7W3PNB6_9MICO|nr:DUF305 domain-containing protein [Alpinimonas psychrophila]MBA8828225.1 uncharacterized protein (DUF305 family) [Alpinimonas psychrophila]